MFVPIKTSALLLLFILGAVVCPRAQSQSNKNAAAAPAPPLLKRSTTRYETRRFAYGGTVTIVGPPSGSIAIEGWQRSEVEVTATIEWQAPTEQDLALLAAIDNFVLDDDANHMRILSTGTHDKAFMRRVAKGFPKRLMGLPWRIDYRIKLPVSTDLEINGGNGPITLSGVDGAVRISALESETRLALTGGDVYVTVLRGSVNLGIPARSWRGRGADVKLGAGNLTIELPAGFNADINADLLRLGAIENNYPELQPRERGGITLRTLRAQTGSGGAMLTFTVGDGTIRIKQLSVER